MNKLIATIAALAITLALNTPSSSAQDAAPAPTAAPAATPATPGGPGPDKIDQFRQKMNEFLKASLKVSDDEWGIIQPLLEKVQTKQRDSLMGRFSFMAGRRGGGDRGGRPTAPEIDALKGALESESSSPADIKSKLEAVREARKKSEGELTQAREDLRKVLTQRQEATLVMVGVLE